MRIVLHSTQGILPLTLAIYCKPSDQEWDVSNIELYADHYCTQLLADDIQLHKLPRSSQLQVIAALNAWDHTKREESRQLMREVAT